MRWLPGNMVPGGSFEIALDLGTLVYREGTRIQSPARWSSRGPRRTASGTTPISAAGIDNYDVRYQ